MCTRVLRVRVRVCVYDRYISYGTPPGSRYTRVRIYCNFIDYFSPSFFIRR